MIPSLSRKKFVPRILIVKVKKMIPIIAVFKLQRKYSLNPQVVTDHFLWIDSKLVWLNTRSATM